MNSFHQGVNKIYHETLTTMLESEIISACGQATKPTVPAVPTPFATPGLLAPPAISELTKQQLYR